MTNSFCAHSSVILLFISLVAREINTKITLLWALKPFITREHTLCTYEIFNFKLQQLECLRSENTHRCPMITHTNDSYQIPSQNNMRHTLLMVVIICGKYGNNRFRAENVTERTRFSESRSNDLEDIGQGQRSSHATHLLMLSDHLYQIWKESIQNCRRYRADTIFKAKAEWPWKYRSRSKVIACDTPSDANDDLCQIWKECKQNCRFFFKVKAEKYQKFSKNSNFHIPKKK